MLYQLLFPPNLVDVDATDPEDARRQALGALAHECQHGQMRPRVYEVDYRVPPCVGHAKETDEGGSTVRG